MRGRGISWAFAALVLLGFALASSGEESNGRRDRGDRGLPVEVSGGVGRKPRPSVDLARPLGIPSDAKRTRVTGVADGDTIDLAGLDSSRLIGIDTPEVYFGAECFGARASAFTKGILPLGTVVFFARGVDRNDDFDRDLIYVWLLDGTFVNALLAKEGYAVPLTIAPNDRFASLFGRLAEAAEASRRGLWARRTCGGDADLPAG